MKSKEKTAAKKNPTKKPEKDINNTVSDETCLYNVLSVSVSQPRPALTEDLTSSYIPYYQRHTTTPEVQPPHAESINQSQDLLPVPATRDQNHHNLVSRPKSKHDASVEARTTGMDAMTQTDNDNAPLAKESADTLHCARDTSESPSERTYSERLDSLSTELSEIRLLLERFCRWERTKHCKYKQTFMIL